MALAGLLPNSAEALSEKEISYLRRAFCLCDADNSGAIDPDELGLVMKSCGYNPSDEELTQMIREADTSGKGEIDFNDFVRLACVNEVVLNSVRQFMKKASALKAQSIKEDDRRLHRIQLKFQKPELETAFLTEYIGSGQRRCSAVWMFLILTLAILASSIMLEESRVVSVLWTGLAALFVATQMLIRATTQQQQLRWLVAGHTIWFGLATILITFAHLFSAQRMYMHWHPLVLGLLLLFLFDVCRPPFLAALLSGLCGLVTYTIIILACIPILPSEWEFPRQLICNIVEIWIFTIVCLFLLYAVETYYRQVFLVGLDMKVNSEVAQSETERANELLENILPKEVVDHALKGTRLRAFSYTYPNASVLQTDICGFTSLSSKLTSSEVINMVDTMVTRFDAIAQAMEVEKIKTIGDAYIAADFLHDFHMERIADSGLCFIEHIRTVKVGKGKQAQAIQIRAGMASGPVTAGIVGYMKCSYDLFGATMKAAEHMEQTGKAMLLQCQQQHMEYLASKYTIEPTGSGQFFITGKRNLSNEGWKKDRRRPMAVSTIDLNVNASGNGTPDPYDFLFGTDMPTAGTTDSLASQLMSECTINDFTLTFSDPTTERRFRTYLLALGVEYDAGFKALGLMIHAFIPVPFLLMYSEDHVREMVLIAYLIIALEVAVLLLSRVVIWCAKVTEEKRPPLLLRKSIYRSSNRIKTLVNSDAENSTATTPTNAAVPLTQRLFKFKPPSVAIQPILRLTAWISIIVTFALAILFITFTAVHAESHSQQPGLLFYPLSISLMRLSVTTQARFPFKVIATISYFVFSVVIFALNDIKHGMIYEFIALGLAFILLMFFGYCFEKAQRHFFLSSRTAVQKRDEIDLIGKRVDRMLLSMLPSSVVERLLQEQLVVDQVPMASIMFVYISPLNPNLSSDQIIQTLNDIMYRLDRGLSESSCVEKIKTNPYMVVSGCPKPSPDHAINLLRLAHKLLYEMDSGRRKGHITDVHIKIGLHSGPLNAGLVGDIKWSYDVFGDTINTASRLACHCEWDKIQISERSYELLKKHRIRFEDRGCLEMKGKGQVRCFYALTSDEHLPGSLGSIAVSRQPSAVDSPLLIPIPPAVSNGSLHLIPNGCNNNTRCSSDGRGLGDGPMMVGEGGVVVVPIPSRVSFTPNAMQIRRVSTDSNNIDSSPTLIPEPTDRRIETLPNSPPRPSTEKMVCFQFGQNDGEAAAAPGRGGGKLYGGSTDDLASHGDDDEDEAEGEEGQGPRPGVPFGNGYQSMRQITSVPKIVLRNARRSICFAMNPMQSREGTLDSVRTTSTASSTLMAPFFSRKPSQMSSVTHLSVFAGLGQPVLSSRTDIRSARSADLAPFDVTESPPTSTTALATGVEEPSHNPMDAV